MTKNFPLPICIPVGNQKVGRIWTFSLPAVLTCPGSSRWCLRHCYARRIEKLRPNCRRAYMRNLALSLETDRFIEHVLHHLPEDAAQVRIHVGGDFYDVPYIKAWVRICKARPQTQFWSYTRSWRIPSLMPDLKVLKSLRNVQLFASCDPGMPLSPNNWRIAFIETDERARGLACPEQQNKLSSCKQCRYCFRNALGHVVFKVH